MHNFEIGGIEIGDGCPPLLLADIGTFFNQDLSLAEHMVRGLKEAGCSLIKGEILHTADIVLDDETLETYFSPETGVVRERYRELVERKVVPLSDYARLFELCRQLGMPVVVSVYDIEGANFAHEIESAALKIASTNVVHRPLIEHAAGLGRPLLLDTGKSSFEEIVRAIQWARDAGAIDIVVEHSPDAPPAPVSEHHLRMLSTLKNVFDCPVGLSDHHDGNDMMIAAVALGAHVIEKGVCMDDAPLDQDVTHAIRLGEVAGLLRRCQSVYEGLGAAMRELPRGHVRPFARMGLVAGQNLRPGDVVSLQTVTFAWPAKGVPVEDWGAVVGWRIRRSVLIGAPIAWSDVEPISA
jgi:sialic acid synthase SpsE